MAPLPSSIVTPDGHKSPHLGERGGTEYNVRAFNAAVLRAELVEIVAHYSIGQAAKIVDALLADYSLTRRRRIGKIRELE